MKETKIRCEWIEGKPDYYVAYHDNVWGKPEHDDQLLFQWLVLESFHVGLSWQLVLSKKADFIEAFDAFDVTEIAEYTDADIERLVNNAKIIRHKGKIKATISNAQAFIAIQKKFGSFDAYIWGFTNGEQVIRGDEPPSSRSVLSDTVTKDMKQRGFKFIGSITIYSYLQAIGIINDHDLQCEFRG